jgi:predicted  nucleic acid-binding Zn-ribbon protein
VSQPLPLRDQLKALENLQEIDIKIDALKKEKSSFPAAMKSLDDGISKLKTSTDLKSKVIADIEKSKNQTSAALDLNRDRLARANSKLEAVQNSHEFQAASKEIEQLKKLSNTLEEQSKKSTSDIESLTKEFGEMNTNFQKVSAEREAQMAMLSTSSQKLDKEINALVSARAQFVPKVEPRLLSQYDRVRAARAGWGIVPAVGGRCKGCNMMVPPQLFIEIQRGNQLHQCPSCNRILFVAAQAPVQSEASA